MVVRDLVTLHMYRFVDWFRDLVTLHMYRFVDWLSEI